MRFVRGIKPVVVFFMVLLALPATSSAARKKPSGQPVAIWKLQALGLSNRRVKVVQKAVYRAFRRNPDWRLQSHGVCKSRLAKVGLDVRAPLDKIASSLGVRYVITGTMAGLGDQVSLDFKLLDGKSGSEVRRVAVDLPAGTEDWDAALDESILRLLSPAMWVGGLDLKVSEAGARVFLDGVEVATTPLAEPLTRLSPGKHILMIQKDGFGEFSKFVFIRYQQLARLEVDMASATVVGLLYEQKDRKPEPPASGPESALAAESMRVARPAPALEATVNWQKIVGWSCLGLGAAVAVSGGFLGWHSSDLERQVENGGWTPRNEDELLDKIDAGNRAASWSNRMFVVGGSLAAVSAAFLIWGYLADGSDGGSAPAVTPAVLSGGIGLGLSGRF